LQQILHIAKTSFLVDAHSIPALAFPTEGDNDQACFHARVSISERFAVRLAELPV
jgi:hypothetical protein